MRWRLDSALSQIAFAGICAGLAACYVAVSTTSFLAWSAGRAIEPAHLRRAARLEPWDAERQYQLGRYAFFVSADMPVAIQSFRSALSLNPYAASTWLDLSAAYLAIGDLAQQGQALEQALKAEPTDPEVEWEAGNLYIVRGDTDRALRLFQHLIAADSSHAAAALDLAWRSTRNVEKVLRLAVPPTAAARLEFLSLLCERKDSAAADQVWPAVLEMKPRLPASRFFFYIDDLLKRRQVKQAGAVWSALADIDSSIVPADGDNLIVNSSFDQEILNGGLGWRYEPRGGVALSLDTAHFHAGSRSLLMNFDGAGISDAGLWQFIPVEPNCRYRFSGFMQGEEVETASGPRFEFADAYTRASLARSDDVLGSTPWREVTAEFATGPNTDLLEVSVGRWPASGRIRGKVWIDDLKLTRSEGHK
ncbi:MAG TPA: hypothetical protein VK473_09065 [Terriglobales bacterium]|nr:hypothetical protein [Terriglobales bacterium]